MNGLVSADRALHPAVWEVKKVYQPAKMRAVDLAEGRIEIRNANAFQDLRGYSIKWEVTEDGIVIEEGKHKALDIAAGQSAELTIPFKKPSPKPGAEYFLNVRFLLAADTTWAAAGHEVAWEQFRVAFHRASSKIAEAAQYARREAQGMGRACRGRGEGSFHCLRRRGREPCLMHLRQSRTSPARPKAMHLARAD